MDEEMLLFQQKLDEDRHHDPQGDEVVGCNLQIGPIGLYQLMHGQQIPHLQKLCRRSLSSK